jgi:hypothetical protein
MKTKKFQIKAAMSEVSVDFDIKKMAQTACFPSQFKSLVPATIPESL